MDNASVQSQQRAIRRLALKLGVAALVMFGFAFAMVPFYDVFCQLTGLNGKTGNAERVDVQAKADPRWVTVEFNSDVMPGLPWQFKPRLNKVRVHPGELVTAWFRVRNVADRPLDGRAVPSVSPPVAARYFRKIECFCFDRQQLKAGEERELPVTFVVSRDLPAEVGVITLSYAFFPSGGSLLAQRGK